MHTQKESITLSQFSENHEEVLRRSQELYNTKMLEVEKRFFFDKFYDEQLRKGDFESKPMVMLLGQYSVGKTSFIEHMLNRPYLGARVGPEPTTDRFVAVMHGNQDQIIPGNALAVDADRPFNALNQFGNGFLSRFEGSIVNAPLLERITFIDTPGILSGEKQRLGRSYDFVKICEWFANRSDLILLFFDTHKLDISDEFKSAIELLKGNEDKVRCILNKADCVSTQQLMRVYGALMWSLGKIVKSPEALRVYIGSFWNKPFANEENVKFFEAEQRDLYEDLLALPRNSTVRKINELVKRARLVKSHAYLIAHLEKKMPMLFGKESAQKELIEKIGSQLKEIEHLHKIPLSDFPEIPKLQERLKLFDFSTFPKFSERLMALIETVLSNDLPQLMKFVVPTKSTEISSTNPMQPTNPMQSSPGIPSRSSSRNLQPTSTGDASSEEWIVDSSARVVYQDIFESLRPVNGEVTEILNIGIPAEYIPQIWRLVDFENSGKLDSEEFALAMYLSEIVKKGNKLPEHLEYQMIPPSKRETYGPKET